MRKLLSPIRIRLIFGSLLFLLGLTGAITLVVRDSLLFSARNMSDVGAKALLDQRRAALLEIARLEAALSDHAAHHDSSDLTPLNQRLRDLQLAPNSYTFVMDSSAKLIAVSSDKIGNLLGEETVPVGAPWQGFSLLNTGNAGLGEILARMQRGESGISQIEIASEPVLIAYAPLQQMGWSFAIVEPVADIAANAQPLTEQINNEVNRILQATLVTIAYFAVVATIGAVIAARALTGPIQTLVQGTRSITAGDLSVRIPVKSSDELGTLANSFNHMAEELLARNTELVQANEALSEREARLRLITEITTDALYEWDIQAGTTQWSHSYRTLFGYPAEGHHEHMWWRERVHPEDLEQAITRLELALKNKEEFISLEYRYRRADGTYAHVVDRGYFFFDEAGGARRMVGAMIDISDRVALSEAQTRAALEERQRLARELHDSVTQSLYSLTLLAEAARRTAQAGDLEKVVGNIARLGETAQQALKEMRLLVYELRPLALEQAGLADALQLRLDAVEKRAGVDAKLLVALDAELPAEMENTLYRIAQETLNNALKHAAATSVSVSLRSQNNQVQMEIRDNGKGFERESIQDKGGLGLVSISERVDALGGSWSILSNPGEGTQVLVSIPFMA